MVTRINISIAGLCVLASVVVSMHQKLHLTDLYDREGIVMRNFLVRFGHMMCQEGFDRQENVVFSPTRIFANLATIHSVASPGVKKDLQLNLGLYGNVEEHQCLALEGILETLCPKKSGNSFRVLYNAILFYQEGLVVNKSALENKCLDEVTSVVDFRQSNKTQAAVNNWYSQLTMGEYTDYLSEALNSTSKVVFMNGIYFNYDSLKPYQRDGVIEFEAINGSRYSKLAMTRLANMYVQENDDFIIIREDQNGENFYSLVVIPKMSNPQDEQLFRYKFIHLRKLIEQATQLQKTERIKLRLPEINIKTRLDLRDIFNVIVSDKLFEEGAIDGLFGNSVHLREYPYSEFINMRGNISNSCLEEENTRIVNVNKPFLYLLVGRKYAVPLETVIYLGYPEDEA